MKTGTVVMVFLSLLTILTSSQDVLATGFCYDPDDPCTGGLCFKELCYADCVPNATSPDPNCHTGYILTSCDCGFACTCLKSPHCTPNDPRYYKGPYGLGQDYYEDLPNDGLDNDCDGFIDDEKCDGIDNDKDGLIDEDVGSCLGKILFVPFCWLGDEDFEDQVNAQLDVFYTALNLNSCKDTFNNVILDPLKVNVKCPATPREDDPVCQDAMKYVMEAVEKAGINKGNINEIVALTDHDICGNIGGGYAGRGSYWAETTSLTKFAHEFGHLYGLREEYSSKEAGGCYNDHNDINRLDPLLGCDPLGGCCGGCKTDCEDPCCAGNENPLGGRCFMSSTNDPPYGYCARCFNQITNPPNKRTATNPYGAVALKCGQKNPIGPQSLGELSFSLTEDGKFDQFSIQTYQGRPSFGGDRSGEGAYEINLFKGDANIFSTRFELAGLFCDGAGCVTEGQTYHMRWKAILPPDVKDSDEIRVFYMMFGDTIVYGQSTINGHPPVAEAGPDQTVECTANGGGEATLDASASSDPDGDSLRYAWEAPGITFDTFMGETTKAVFPLGETMVTLKVGDGSLAPQSYDTVKIKVQDTKPPVLTPPAAITISSCKSPDIGTATAVDACRETGVTLTNNAPSVFPLGETIVTWTATDSFGNTATAEQKVMAILGDDPSCCPPGTNIIIGTEGDDDLIGTPGSDCILGLGGDDTLNGKKGNDFLSGGAGNDTLVTDDGSDYLVGGPGRDKLNAGKGVDTCVVDRTDNVVNCENVIYYSPLK